LKTFQEAKKSSNGKEEGLEPYGFKPKDLLKIQINSSSVIGDSEMYKLREILKDYEQKKEFEVTKDYKKSTEKKDSGYFHTGSKSYSKTRNASTDKGNPKKSN